MNNEIKGIDLFAVVKELLAGKPKTIVRNTQNKGKLVTISLATHEQEKSDTVERSLFVGNTKDELRYLKGMRDALTLFND